MNVLLSSVGRRAYLVNYFKEELEGRGKVICTNSSKLSTAVCVADEAFESPLIYDGSYIPFLLDLCKKKNINVLVSLFDIDLPVLAKNRDKFEALGVKLIVSKEEIINICNDKLLMFGFLKENNFDTVYTGTDIEDEYIKNRIGKHKRFILKPRWGMGSLGIYTSDDYSEAQVLFKKIKKEIQASYLKFEAKADTQNCVLIQELVEGDEYGLDIINDLEGNHVTTIVKKKLAMRSGETDIAVVKRNQRLEDFGKKIAGKTKHIANMDLDLIVNDEGIFVIDMNARFGGGYPFSHMAGVNFVKVLLDLCEAKDVDREALQIKNEGIYAKDISIMRIGQV
jgi:carbamoylphosphate synthase